MRGEKRKRRKWARGRRHVAAHWRVWVRVRYISPLTSHLSLLTSHFSPLTSHLSLLTPRTDWNGSSGRWNKKQLLSRLMLSICRVKLIRDFLAFFKPTDADASVLLIAYGIHTIDLDQLQSCRSAEQTEGDRTSDRLPHRQQIAEPPSLFP